MKAATQYYKCNPGTGKLAHAGTTQRSATGVHMPARRPAPRNGASPDMPDSVPDDEVVPMDAARARSAQLNAAYDGAVPRVLHIDRDPDAGRAMAALLMPEVQVVHVETLADARRLLGSGIWSMVVLDTALPDGDGTSLLSALSNTPLLVYSARQPDARHTNVTFLPKPWSTPRQLWSAVSELLGMNSTIVAGD